MSDPLFVYGNWAAYDELSDGIELTEELAMGQLRELLRMRSKGVRFDAYLMDAFWFAKDGAYRTWRKPHWPDGPDRWFDACRENGLLPGLWFTANTLFQLDLPSKWADSIDAGGWGLCLFKGGFLDDFMEVLDHWYQRGIRLFKFDFAEFNAVPAGLESSFAPQDARAVNVETYRKALQAFRTSHPEAVLMAYNGFEERPCMDRGDLPPGHYIDPEWLKTFDSLYCGDPRPSELPCTSFWRSVDLYSDCMVRLFQSSGIPLDRIDNCAFMAGPTGTCYWRGNAAWKGMLLLSLARGGRIHVAYGDLSLFNDAEAEWWAAAQRLLAPGMRPGATSSFGGWPATGRPFGWRSGNVLTVVNPRTDVAQTVLPEGQWRIIAGDPGFDARVASDRLTLGPDQIAVLSSGDAAELKMDEPVGIDASFQRLNPSTVDQARLGFNGESGRFRYRVRQTDDEGNAKRTFPDPSRVFPFRVVVTDRNGERELPPMFDRTIWSGISWAAGEFKADGLSSVVVMTTEPEANLEVELSSSLTP